MAWTTAQEVIDAWIGDDAPSDSPKINLWIGRAERLVRNAIPGIQVRLTALEVDLLENVKDVVGSMVERKFRNPDGIRQASSTTGPFSEQRTFGGNDPGELALLDSEIALLSGSRSSGQRAFTVDMIPRSSPFAPHRPIPVDRFAL